MSSSDLVVKNNILNSAIQNLSLAEIRLIQLAIVDARETNTGLSTDKPLRIDAMRYAKVFGTTPSNGYKRMKEAEKTLFSRQFSYLNERGNVAKSAWIADVEYLNEEGAILIALTRTVVNFITRIDGNKREQFFTQYLLKQTVNMKSYYSVRVYELVIQWREAKKTPVFKLEKFRDQIGVGVNEYKTMSDFKKRVLDLAVKEINEHSDIKLTYEQVKSGRNIIGFKFKLLPKSKPIKTQVEMRDGDTSDMFTIEKYSDKQLGRIARGKQFKADYNHLVSPTSPANHSDDAWEFEMINRLKKDPTIFNKRPIKDYLEY